MTQIIIIMVSLFLQDKNCSCSATELHLLLDLKGVFGYIITGDVAFLTCTNGHGSPPFSRSIWRQEREIDQGCTHFRCQKMK